MLFLPGTSAVYVDLRMQLPPVTNQGSIACSAAHALCAAYEHALFTDFRASPLFAFYNERIAPKAKDPEEYTIENALLSMLSTGVCSEELFPSSLAQHGLAGIMRPDSSAYDDAAARPIDVHRIKNDKAAIKKCLSSNFPIVTAVKVFNDFHHCPSDGMVPMPRPKEKPIVGNENLGQAIVLVGYDDECDGGVWIVRNSLSADWGVDGHAYLPYEYERHFADLWVITLGTI